MTSASVYVWGAGGGALNYSDYSIRGGAGGGFATGTLTTSPGQSLYISAGEGGESGGNPNPATIANPSFLNGGIASPANAPGLGTQKGGAGGGLAGIFNNTAPNFTEPQPAPATTPGIYIIAGSGGAGGGSWGGVGGGTQGYSASNTAQTNNTGPGCGNAGGGSQSAGGQAGITTSDPAINPGPGQTGGFLFGGNAAQGTGVSGGGGAGYYGGGGGGYHPQNYGGGGGGSSYIGSPLIACGSTTAGGSPPSPNACYHLSGGRTSPLYPGISSCSGDGGPNPAGSAILVGDGHSLTCRPASAGDQVLGYGGDGYVLITGTGCTPSPGGSSTIVSSTFTSSSVATSARIVVFQEDVETPTLNTDIIASVSRDGTNFTNATLSDSGYVTGSSGQRILTGQADISGQPSGQSMRWKLALANNTVKIHGVALQWS
jgi:hypothetical protein